MLELRPAAEARGRSHCLSDTESTLQEVTAIGQEDALGRSAGGTEGSKFLVCVKSLLDCCLSAKPAAVCNGMLYESVTAQYCAVLYCTWRLWLLTALDRSRSQGGPHDSGALALVIH